MPTHQDRLLELAGAKERRRADLLARMAAPETLLDRLQHTLVLFGDEPADSLAITATMGVFGDGVQTGLTWGDLRQVQEVLRNGVARGLIPREELA